MRSMRAYVEAFGEVYEDRSVAEDVRGLPIPLLPRAARGQVAAASGLPAGEDVRGGREGTEANSGPRSGQAA